MKNISNRLLHIEPIGGIAGDMFVASMINTYPEMQKDLLNTINAFLPKYVKCSFTLSTNSGINGQRFVVKIDNKDEAIDQ